MNVPDTDDALKAVQPIMPAIYGALEAGTQAAREFFESRAADIEPYHAASTARWEAKRYLQDQGHQVASGSYSVAGIANNGLRVTFGKYVLWILKSPDGLLPIAASGTKRLFYAQQLSLAFPGADPSPGTLALVVLWDATPDYRLGDLVLACPEGGAETLASVRAHWYIPVPHPASIIESAGNQQEPMDDDDLSNIKFQGVDKSGANPGP
jgi:hypothetical protein